MLAKILFAERTETVGFRPIFNAICMESMFAEIVGHSISVLSVLVKADRALVIATPGIVVKMERILEKPLPI